MMHRRASVILLTACVAITASGCQLESVSSGPTEPIQPSLNQSRVGRMTHDDILEALVVDIPGFGGLYRDSASSVVVFLTEMSAAGSAEATIRRALERADGQGLREFGPMSKARMEFKQGRHTFRELANWRRSLYERGIPAGTIMSGIDKRTNSLLVGLASAADQGRWDELARSAGLPSDVVRYQVMEVPTPRAGVHDRIRPTAGGIQITVAQSQGSFLCTLGANISYVPDPGNKYFITASHCSNNMWAVDTYPTEWYQATVLPADLIATGEAVDPPPFSGGGCPAGRVCRYSDVTLVKYSVPTAWQLGKMAYGAGGPVPPPTNWAITGYHNFVDQPFCCFFEYPWLVKTGRTTGSTHGGIQSYCMDFHLNQQAYANSGVIIGPNWTMLCQYWGTGWVHSGGDSGAPVSGQFGEMPPNDVFFDGIYHAGNSTNFIYSPFANMGNDFGWGSGWGNLLVH